MSRSRKKQPFYSHTNAGSMKAWKQDVNQRYRHRCKQLINTCMEWDSLVLPTIDETGNVYNSPKDGRMGYAKKPLINDCEIDYQEAVIIYGLSAVRWRRERYELDHNGHNKYCNCYYNKRSWYWKALRK